jgi:hypothetical protein
MSDALRGLLVDEPPPGATVVDGDEPVDAVELSSWFDCSVSEVEALTAAGVLTRGESGLFPLWPSVKAAIRFWENAVAMGAPRGRA